MGKKGDQRELGWGLKIVTVLVSLLFFLVTAAMAPALPLDSGSSGYAVTEASPSLAGEWIEKANTTKAGALGGAVVGTGDYIYIAWCRYSTKQPEFWCYGPIENKWNYSMNNSSLPKGAFRNGAALAWDHNDYIYALLGGRYPPKDIDRALFYRYAISDNIWKQLNDTPCAQGAGDAITWSGYDNFVYAIIGDRKKGSEFARYNCSSDSWENLALNSNWSNVTDDGASLVWTGGEYLYALQGEVDEDKHQPNTNFSRYNIQSEKWEDRKSLEQEEEGIGDGGSLLWIGNWIPKYNNYIFALGGASGLKGEELGNNFYGYCISRDNWTELTPIPCPIGKYVGNRFGFAKGHIYYWQGSPENEAEQVCNGSAFFMFEFEATATSFDTGPGMYPSIFGTHNGTITPNQTINVSKLYTYPCVRTGGHTEYARIWNSTLDEITRWDGYKGDWHNISFNEPFTLLPNETYNYTIKTGSYPQIHHTPALPTANGWINCTEFRDANGKIHYDWIPAIKLYF